MSQTSSKRSSKRPPAPKASRATSKINEAERRIEMSVVQMIRELTRFYPTPDNIAAAARVEARMLTR